MIKYKKNGKFLFVYSMLEYYTTPKNDVYEESLMTCGNADGIEWKKSYYMTIFNIISSM